MMNINEILQSVIDLNASDLHCIVGFPPTLRIEGELISLDKAGIVTPEVINGFLKNILTPEKYELLVINKELDFSLQFSSKARFRVNAYTQKGTLAIAFRRIPLEIPSIDFLGLPNIVHSFTNLKQGLVLVTGPTGHGKSTTLAAILNEINKFRSCHIVSIEDPIEFILHPIKSIISQREMQADTHSWQIALRSVLREDPDVVLVGEMRDYETIAAALTVAETGHLVFATLHTNSAAQTIDRIVDVFPQEQQRQIRLQLSNTVEAVLSQRLIPGVDKKRVVACEVMLATTAIRTAIREGKTYQIDSILQTSGQLGMFTLEHSLSDLVKQGKVSFEVARSWALRPEELTRLVNG